MRNVKRLLLAALLLTSPLMTLAADDAPSADPDVTIRQDGDKTIQEYRQNGFLYAIKITPKHGPAGHVDSGLEDLRVVRL
jgi:hypothetical protein